MSQNFQFGYNHHLYIGWAENAGVVSPVKVSGTLAEEGTISPINISEVDWDEFLNVTTVNVGGSSQTVDITTRAEARSGFSTNVIVTTQGQMTFDVRYKPRADDGSIQDKPFEALLTAWITKQEIWGVDLDKPRDQLGAQGLFGNWTVNITNKKELQGAVMCTVEMNLSSFPVWVRLTDDDPETWYEYATA